MAWTDDRVTTLKKLWLDGLSASQIAKQLGGFPGSPDGGRNAVIGKVHRLGLTGRAQPSQPGRPASKAPRPPRPIAVRPVRASPPQASAALQPAPVPRVEEPGSATIQSLGAHICKWPIGDPLSDDFTFCGRRSNNKDPYCLEHTRVAYQVSSKRGPRAPHHNTNHVNF